MAQNAFSTQVPCIIRSLTELASPRPQTKLVDGVEVATRRLDQTHILALSPIFDEIEDLTPERKTAIANAVANFAITAYEMEYLRLTLQAPTFSSVCGQISNSTGNIAVITYSEYITGTKYINYKGVEFNFKPKEKYPVGSVRYVVELTRDFFTKSESLKREHLATHMKVQEEAIRQAMISEKSSLDETRALLKQRRELARLNNAPKPATTTEPADTKGAEPTAEP